MTPALVGLTVGGDAAAWTAAGFTVVDGRIAMGTVDVRVSGEAEGVTNWSFTEVDDGVLDGIATFTGSATEWLPMFGESWQLLQLPWITDRPVTSLSPATPLMSIGIELNNCSPRAIAARARPRGSRLNCA